MTISTLDQISAYQPQVQERLIPEQSEVQAPQDRTSDLNRELLSAIGREELNRAQNTNYVAPSEMSDETRQLVAGVAGYNSRQAQLEIYINGMYGDSVYEANTINLENYANPNRISTYLYA